MKRNFVTLYYGGMFINNGMVYVGGSKCDVDIDVENFLFDSFQDFIKTLMGEYIEVTKIHFKIAEQTLAQGCMLLSEMSCNDMVNLVKQYGHVEVYTEHNLLRGQLRDSEDVCNLTCVTPINEGANLSNELSGGISDLAKQSDAPAEITEDIEFEFDVPIEVDNVGGTCEGDNTDEEIVECQWMSDDDEELQDARNCVKQFKQGKKFKSQHEKTDATRRRSSDVNGEPFTECDGNDTDYFDSCSDYSAVSTDGSDEDCAVRRRSKYPSFEPGAEKVSFSLGMKLDGPKKFKDALIKFSIQQRRDIKYERNTKDEVRAVCVRENCPWTIFASIDNASQRFLVKTYIPEHTCPISYKNKKVTTKWLAKHYFYKYESIATMKLIDLKKLVKEDLKVEMNLNKIKRAKMLVIVDLQGEAKKEFSLLWDYLGEIRRSNPGSTTIMEVHRPIQYQPPVFERLYISFEYLKRGMLSGCRRVIGLDGYFLKGSIKGEILAAVGRDGNNQMFPVAWGLVDSERRITWEWFLELLQNDLNLGDGDGWTIITDQQKGLLDAVSNLLPRAEHRCCARHLYANWRKSHGRSMELQKQFWLCVKATNMPDFENSMNEMKKLSPAAFEAMLHTHPRHWCRAYFNIEVKCDIVDNNLIEAFNGKIVNARTKNVVSMLEEIRKLVMTRLHTNRDLATKWIDEFGNRIRKQIHDNYVESGNCEVIWNGENGFEIAYKGKRALTHLCVSSQLKALLAHEGCKLRRPKKKAKHAAVEKKRNWMNTCEGISAQEPHLTDSKICCQVDLGVRRHVADKVYIKANF